MKCKYNHVEIKDGKRYCSAINCCQPFDKCLTCNRIVLGDGTSHFMRKVCENCLPISCPLCFQHSKTFIYYEIHKDYECVDCFLHRVELIFSNRPTYGVCKDCGNFMDLNADGFCTKCD